MSTFPASLLQGYQSFRSGRYPGERERFRNLAEAGQKPETLVVACCDSRAAPETIFNALPGEIFVVRNVANIVPPNDPEQAHSSVAAAIEFAVLGLGVRNIVVMGHAKCGGVNAALTPDRGSLSEGDYVGMWTALLSNAADSVLSDASVSDEGRQIALEHLSVRNSIANLRTFPFVAEREKDGRLVLLGAWFDIASGELWTLNSETGKFERAADGMPAAG